MNIDEILSAISKFRQEKLKNVPNSRSKSPLSSITASKLPSRSLTPINPNTRDTSPFLPRHRNHLKNPAPAHKPFQISDYKLDAASLIIETFRKFKRRIFHTLEKNIRNSQFTVESSFIHTGMTFISPRLKKEYFNKLHFYEDKDLYHSPSFSKNSKILFGGLSSISEGVAMISSVYLKKFEHVKRFIWTELVGYVKKKRNFWRTEKMVKVLTVLCYKVIFGRLRIRDAYHKRTWELPLKIDLKNISRKSEMSDFSSADQSEVLFEQVLDSSSQFTNRFQNSGEKAIKELTLSSIISYEDRQNTDRVFNLTKLKYPTGGCRKKKVSYDISDSLSDSQPLVSKSQGVRFQSKARIFQKPLGILAFFIENHLKSSAFSQIFQAFKDWKLRNSVGKLVKVANSQLKNVIVYVRRLNKFPKLVKKLTYIGSSQNLVAVVKVFVKWKVWARVSKEKLKKKERFSRSLPIAIKKVAVKKELEAFRMIKNLKIVRKFQFSLILCLVNALKRVVSVALSKKKTFAFSILCVVHKECVIKAYHIGKIVSNIDKDIYFRLGVCFGHWKKSVVSEKSQYLQVLSFIQSITRLFEVKKRFAFNVLAYYERSFLNLSYT